MLVNLALVLFIENKLIRTPRPFLNENVFDGIKFTFLCFIITFNFRHINSVHKTIYIQILFHFSIKCNEKNSILSNYAWQIVSFPCKMFNFQLIISNTASELKQ